MNKIPARTIHDRENRKIPGGHQSWNLFQHHLSPSLEHRVSAQMGPFPWDIQLSRWCSLGNQDPLTANGQEGTHGRARECSLASCERIFSHNYQPAIFNRWAQIESENITYTKIIYNVHVYKIDRGPTMTHIVDSHFNIPSGPAANLAGGGLFPCHCPSVQQYLPSSSSKYP